MKSNHLAIRHLFLPVLMLLVALPSVGQEQTSRLDPSHQSVYLRFLKNGPYKSPCGEPERDGILLQLVNNSRWAIILDGEPVSNDTIFSFRFTSGDSFQTVGVKNGSELRLRYDFDRIPRYETKRQDGNITLQSPVESPLTNLVKILSRAMDAW